MTRPGLMILGAHAASVHLLYDAELANPESSRWGCALADDSLPSASARTLSIERCAFHESGHAIVFLALGFQVHSVTICPDAAAGTRGLTAAIIEEGGNFLSRATACFGGAAAVKCWDPTNDGWQIGAASDLADADKFIARATPFARDNAYAVRVATLRLRARTAAEALVKNHWRAVQILATVLQQMQTIDGAAAARIFQRTISD